MLVNHTKRVSSLWFKLWSISIFLIHFQTMIWEIHIKLICQINLFLLKLLHKNLCLHQWFVKWCHSISFQVFSFQNHSFKLLIIKRVFLCQILRHHSQIILKFHLFVQLSLSYSFYILLKLIIGGIWWPRKPMHSWSMIHKRTSIFDGHIR